MKRLRIHWLGVFLLMALPGRSVSPDSYITLHRLFLSRLGPVPTLVADSQRVRSYFELTRLYIEKADAYAGADGSFDSARYFNQQHLALAYRHKWLLEEAEALTFRAKIAHLRNAYDESYQAALRALSLFARFPPGRCRNLYECLHRMGRIHFKTLEDYPAALTYFGRALAVAPSQQQRAFTLRQLGTCHGKLGQFDQARRYYEHSLSLARSPYDRGMCLNFLGEAARTAGDTARAIGLFNAALRADNHTMVQSAALTYLADTYWQLHQPQRALHYATLALRPASHETNNLADRAEAFRLLYLTHRHLGQTAAALRYHERYLATRDSLPNRDGMKQYFALKIKQQDEERREREEDFQRELRQQRQTRNLTGAVAGLFFILGLTLLIGYRVQRRKNDKISRQAAEISTQNETILDVQRQLSKANQQLRQANLALEDKIIERTAELLRANEALLHKNDEIQEALVKGQTLERKRVAAELHDNLGGLLSAAQLSIKILNPDQLPPREQQVYQNALQLISEAYQEVRLISHNLLPEELEKVGLAENLRRLVNKLNLSHYVRFSLDVTSLNRRLGTTTEFHLYNIALELTNNVLKHAGATEASLRFEGVGNELTLIVTDNGRGFQPGKTVPGKQGEGMGLNNIRSRAESIGGVLEVDSEPGTGTTFRLRVPLDSDSQKVKSGKGS